ncbi:trp operon repressor [Vibrio breoganii]|uniref:Trp operon repressor homolog n=4 Tax=Vibrio TaxID=662 RepID=A0AAP8N063_9VIBR|nr:MULTISPECIES: trp operon repressor [Vibrio]ANO32143.1 Trp operon repressor [Vibrio breoganii]MDN3716499.1 trp operon repressor [Vibrio breoganii]NMO72488.1 trp operon repressor [Vibrio breoganii]NMR69278.1 trp operon repressor [Vibrio breoganii]OCH75975.1 Trp operon repressor [Vibrio breoganii]
MNSVEQEWQKLLFTIAKATEEGEHQTLLSIMLTPDEKEALVTRAKILHKLLNEKCSQRQISQELGVGIATVTRGSNELKRRSEEEQQLVSRLLKPFIE